MQTAWAASAKDELNYFKLISSKKKLLRMHYIGQTFWLDKEEVYVKNIERSNLFMQCSSYSLFLLHTQRISLLTEPLNISFKCSTDFVHPLASQPLSRLLLSTMLLSRIHVYLTSLTSKISSVN